MVRVLNMRDAHKNLSNRASIVWINKMSKNRPSPTLPVREGVVTQPPPALPNLPKGRRSHQDGYSLPLGGAGGGWGGSSEGVLLTFHFASRYTMCFGVLL